MQIAVVFRLLYSQLSAIGGGGGGGETRRPLFSLFPKAEEKRIQTISLLIKKRKSTVFCTPPPKKKLYGSKLVFSGGFCFKIIYRRVFFSVIFEDIYPTETTQMIVLLISFYSLSVSIFFLLLDGDLHQGLRLQLTSLEQGRNIRS